MSDPVSNVEIEDVLTSIRRLVSDDDWGHSPLPASHSTTEEPQSKAPSKFLLTPALRVVEPSQAGDQEETVGDDGERDIPEEFFHYHQEAESAPAEEQAASEGQEPAKPSIEDVIADLEAAVGFSHEWEDVSDDYEDEADVTFDAQPFLAQPSSDQTDFDTEAADHAFSADLDDDIAAFMQEDSVIDEEALRKLVAEVIRQELQGALGERITRNVRKLVRREIYRILASEDFN